MKTNRRPAYLFAFILLGTALFLYQQSNQHQLSEAVQTWQNTIIRAQPQLIGKNPEQVAAFLSQWNVKHDPYMTGPVSMAGKDTGQWQGLLSAHIGPVAHTLGVGGVQNWYITILFFFDNHNRYRYSSVGTQY